MKSYRNKGERISASETWYFARLAFLAIPWNSRHQKDAKGTLFKQYYLLRAKDIDSAFNKATRILNISDHCDGDARLNGEKVIFKKIGILDLEPLYEKLQSGIEIFDESEIGIRFQQVKKQTVSNQRRRRLNAYEKKMGKPSLLDVYWGDDFDRL